MDANSQKLRVEINNEPCLISIKFTPLPDNLRFLEETVRNIRLEYVSNDLNLDITYTRTINNFRIEFVCKRIVV